MYHEFYPSLFTALGIQCDPYDGSYRWNCDPPKNTVISAIEKLPTGDGFRKLDLSTDKEAQKVKSVLSAEQWNALVAFQKQLRSEARAAKYKAESDVLLAEALYDSIRTDGKSVDLKDSAWAQSVMKVKQEPSP